MRRTVALAVAMAAIAAVVLAPAAQAESGGLFAWGEVPFSGGGTPGMIIGGPTAIDPADGDDIFTVDLQDGGQPQPLLRKFTPAGTELGHAPIPTENSGGATMIAASIAIDPVLHRLYVLMDANDDGPGQAREVLVYSTQPDEAGNLVAPSDADAVADGVDDGVLVDFREPSAASGGVDSANGIAVDPGTHKVVLLGLDDVDAAEPHPVIQYITQAGAASTRVADITGMPQTGATDPDAVLATVPPPAGLAIAPDGTVYVVTGQPEYAGEVTTSPARVYRLARESGSATLFVKDRNEPSISPGAATFPLEYGAGSSIAVSTDGETLWVREGNGAGSRVRGFSTATTPGVPRILYGYLDGSGSGPCYMAPSPYGGLAAGSGNTVVVQLSLTTTEDVHVFGDGGTGCPKPEPKFTIDGQSGGTITLDKGAEVELDATSSDLRGVGGVDWKLDWDLDGSGDFATETPIAEYSPLKGTYRVLKAGTYQIGLKIESDNGAPPVTAPVYQAVKVVAPTPTASFTVSTRSPASGQAVKFDASASVDPAGSPTAEPTHELATYRWDFGDGATQTTGTPKVDHTFTNSTGSAQARTVKLTVVSHDEVESAPVQQTVTVAAAPAADPPGGGGGGGDNPPPSGGGENPPAAGTGTPPASVPAPATPTKPGKTAPAPVKCKKGQVKKKGKCVKKPARHKPKKKHHK
ncbi:MAG TPA: PKD domain-containing protein [Solirubrobacterales bacterium]|nr:PKD domain-containing protein [Solirubrobacterales bacterium]